MSTFSKFMTIILFRTLESLPKATKRCKLQNFCVGLFCYAQVFLRGGGGYRPSSDCFDVANPVFSPIYSASRFSSCKSGFFGSVNNLDQHNRRLATQKA